MYTPSSVSSTRRLFARAVRDPSADTLRITRPFFPRGAIDEKVNVDACMGESVLRGSRRRAVINAPKSSSGRVKSVLGSGELSSSRRSSYGM